MQYGKIQKWGNSNGIRIPSSILKSLDIDTNDTLEIREEEEQIIIKKTKPSKISIKERFEQYNGEDLSKEFEWDEERGNEIW